MAKALSRLIVFDNKHYPRGFSRHGHFTIKAPSYLSAMVLLSTNWIWVNAPRRTKKNSLFLYAVVSVCRKQQKKVWIKVSGAYSQTKTLPHAVGGKPQIDPSEDYTDTDD